MTFPGLIQNEKALRDQHSQDALKMTAEHKKQSGEHKEHTQEHKSGPKAHRHHTIPPY